MLGVFAVVFFQLSEVDRSNVQMCEEVAHELTIQIDEGMIDKKRGEEIIARCFRTFTDAK